MCIRKLSNVSLFMLRGCRMWFVPGGTQSGGMNLDRLSDNLAHGTVFIILRDANTGPKVHQIDHMIYLYDHLP
jgi:hypothetical protein